LLERYLRDPSGFGRGLVRAAKQTALDVLPWLVLGVLIVVLVMVGRRLLVRLRDRRLGHGARRVRILPPPQVDPQRARLLWMGMHAILRPWWKRLILGQPQLVWEVTSRPEELDFGVWIPESIPPGLVERAVEVAFPGARADIAEADPIEMLGASGSAEVCELALAEPEWFPVGEQGEDPLALGLAAMGGLADGEAAAIQILARPVSSASRYRLLRAARVLRAGGKPGALSWRVGRGRSAYRPAPDPTLETDVRAILAKASSPLWHGLIRVAVVSPDPEAASGRIHGLAGSFAVFEGRNGLRRRRIHDGLSHLRRRTMRRPYLLSVPELAQFATLPGAGAVPGLERARARTVAPARTVPSSGRILGTADHAGVRRQVGVSIEDSRHHVHVLGETGTGKSTLLANLVLQDAAAGCSAVVIDPKGDLVEAILERLPDGAEQRTCVLDPNDEDAAIGLNVLSGDDPDLVVDHVLAVFKRIYEPWWGPRTDDIMRAACLTLTQIPGATLAEVPLLLSHYDWRRNVRERLTDVVGVSTFWSWYEKLPENQRVQHIAPLLNKLRAFLLRGPVRAIVGQADPKLDVGALLDRGGLLLVRIPKGTLGEDTSRLLGAFVIARVWQACMRRASLAEQARTDTTLYVDEMHNYLALPRSFEDLLAEARGYRLSLVLAHQHLGQLPREMRDALTANARTKLVFACSPDDATQLERQFKPELTAHDLSHLAGFQAACRPCVAGGQAPAFTFTTQPLGAGSPERAAQIRAASEAAYGVARRDIEEEIVHRHLKAQTLLLPRAEQSTGRRGGRPIGRAVGHPGGRP
jgi:hypothetical protein